MDRNLVKNYIKFEAVKKEQTDIKTGNIAYRLSQMRIFLISYLFQFSFSLSNLSLLRSLYIPMNS